MTLKAYGSRCARVLPRLVLEAGKLAVILTALLICIGAGILAYLAATRSCPPWGTDAAYARSLMEWHTAKHSYNPISKVHIYVLPGMDGKRRDTCDIDAMTPAAIVATPQGLRTALDALAADEASAPSPGDMKGPSMHLLIHGEAGSAYLIAVANTGQDQGYTLHDGMGRFYRSQRLAGYFRELGLTR